MTTQRFTIKEIDNFSYGIKVTDIILDNGIEVPQSTVCDLLNHLHEENEELKQRNENQYQQLNQLWKLIEAKDWETLTAMDNQMKEDEERLQQEWKCYE